MNLSVFAEEWASLNSRSTEEVKKGWDLGADNFAAKTNYSDTDGILPFFQKKNIDIAGMDILDLGCGPGRHSILMAKNGAARVTGLDISPKLTEHCRAKAKEENLSNAEFITAAWEEFDINKEGWKGRFDLAFSSISPAICTAEALNKFTAASKKYCYLSSYATRSDNVYEYLLSQLGGTVNESYPYYIFNILWLQGIRPDVEYITDASTVELSLDEACGVYGEKAPRFRKLNAGPAEIMQCLEKIAVDGRIKASHLSKRAVFFWEV